MDSAAKSFAWSNIPDPRAMMPPGYVLPSGQPFRYATDSSQPQYAPPGSAPPPGYAPPSGYAPPPGYAPLPGYVPPPGYVPSPGYAAPPGYAPQSGNAAAGYAPFGGMPSPGYSSASVVPAPGGMPFVPFVSPVGQTPSEIAARVGFVAFSAGIRASAYAGIAQMIGLPQPQPQSTDDPRNQITKGHWDTGLFRCCDHCVPNGLMACVCPCVALAQVLTRLGNPRYLAVLLQFAFLWIFPVIARLVPEIMVHSVGVNEPELPFVVNVPLIIVPQCMTAMMIVGIRSRLRTRFRIPGACCEDCAVACFCGPCAIAQMATHVKSYTAGDCAFGPPDMLPPFL